MARVDPFVIQWPQKWVDDPEIQPVIDYLNRFLHDMFIRSGGATDLAGEAVQDPVETKSIINVINQRLGSGQFLTSDCDSFTIDSDILFIDQTEA